MARNYYAEINLHLVWRTKNDGKFLVPKVEAIAHHHLRGKCINTPGVFIHEIGGIEDHVHLCISIPPTLLISDFVGKLKGSCSHEVNQKLAHKALEWQAGYGVVSFGTKDLPWVKSYVKNQKERHASGNAQKRLERITEIETDAEAEQREAP